MIEDLFPATEEDCVTQEQIIGVLRRKLYSYELSGPHSLYFAINRKSNETAASLNGFMMNLKSDDKTFERFERLIKLMPDLTKTLDTLRRDFLKISEEEAKELENKGIPLIEQGVIHGEEKAKKPRKRS